MSDFVLGLFTSVLAFLLYKALVLITTNAKQRFFNYQSQIQRQKAYSTMRGNTLMSLDYSSKKEKKYLVFEANTLFFYKDESLLECVGCCLLENCKVEIYPHTLDVDLRFMKEFPLRLYSIDSSVFMRSKQIFLFFDSKSLKEDWFIALNNSKTQDLFYGGEEPTQHDKLKQRDEPKQHDEPRNDLLNSLLQRIFLNVYKDPQIPINIVNGFQKKLDLIQRPFFVENIKLMSVEIGTELPLLSNFEHTGSLSFQLDFDYKGSFKIHLATRIQVVSIELLLKIKHVSGRIECKIKEYPSDRLWFAFQRPPLMDIEIEPLVATKSIKLSLLESIIKTKLIELISDFMVMPNMDDIPLPFYNE